MTGKVIFVQINTLNQKNKPAREGQVLINDRYQAFLLMQLRSSKATSRRLMKLSSPLRSHTRGS